MLWSSISVPTDRSSYSRPPDRHTSNHKEGLVDTRHHGFTALHVAARHSNATVVRYSCAVSATPPSTATCRATSCRRARARACVCPDECAVVLNPFTTAIHAILKPNTHTLPTPLVTDSYTDSHAADPTRCSCACCCNCARTRWLQMVLPTAGRHCTRRRPWDVWRYDVVKIVWSLFVISHYFCSER